MIFCLPVYDAIAGDKWELKKESDGIKIYTATVANANVKALKADFTATGTAAQLAAVLLDVNAQKQWVYRTQTSSLIKRIAAHEILYYTEKCMPWPISNRDGVMRLKIEQDAITHEMTVIVSSVPDVMPAKPGIIRVSSAMVTWTVTPVDANTIRIVYEARVDPGGSVPAWLTNMCCSKGTLETFKGLRKTITSNAYHSAAF